MTARNDTQRRRNIGPGPVLTTMRPLARVIYEHLCEQGEAARQDLVPLSDSPTERTRERKVTDAIGELIDVGLIEARGSTKRRTYAVREEA